MWLNTILRRFGIELSRTYRPHNSGNRFALSDDGESAYDLDTRKILNLLTYAKISGSPYSAEPFESGYHSLRLGDHFLKGQRDPARRLDSVPFSFSGAAVLDIGCNQGGMLFQLADQIRYGIGIDYDSRMINAATRIRSLRSDTNLEFYSFDLERENLDIIDNFLPDDDLDIVLLLSVCMWIRNWRDVIRKSHSLADSLLFESNGTDKQQAEQMAFLSSTYATVTMLREHSPDDPNQKKRKLYLCRS